MCGIYALLTTIKSQKDNTNSLEKRGPNMYGKVDLKVKETFITLEHYRLNIVGNDKPQPIYNKEHDIYLIVNGEIFNYKSLEKELNYTTTFSDCEILIPLYIKYQFNLDEFFSKINGQYSFVLIDLKNNKLFASRDQIGVTSMYYGYNKNSLVFSSNLTSIKEYNTFFMEPRTYFYTDISNPVLKVNKYIDFSNSKVYEVSEVSKIENNIKEKLTKAVKLRMENLDNVEYGFLLSGGLDSSLIASIASKNQTKKINTFSVGLNENSVDILFANKVAKYLNTDHHNYFITPEEIEENVENVVKAVETYDTTTIRASMAMYLLIKKIKEEFKEIKVLFSGELSDELFCYLYGSNAPSSKDFQAETEKLVNNVYLFDCLRADKTSTSFGVEIRVPFSDPEYVKYILSIDPELKQFGKNGKMEKQLLRDSFKDQNYLPNEVLYRKKEQFSDGVSEIGEGQNMIDIMKNYAKKYVNENNLKNKNYNDYLLPITDEELCYRNLYENEFKEKNIYIIKKWEPNWSDTKDPSGRLQEFWCS